VTRFNPALLKRTQADVATVRGKLRARVNSQRVLIAFQLLFGVPLMFLGPGLLSTLIWLKTVGMASFLPLFAIISLAMIPLLLLAEARSSGKFAENIVSDYDPGWNPLTRRTGGQMVAVVIFSTFGPGLVMGAVRRIRGQLQHAAAPLYRCAEVAAQLLSYDGGVDIFTVEEQGESFEDLLTVIEWLVHYNWVGVGSQGRRVWILSDAKKTLAG
jgi:hypothetical protein